MDSRPLTVAGCPRNVAAVESSRRGHGRRPTRWATTTAGWTDRREARCREASGAGARCAGTSRAAPWSSSPPRCCSRPPRPAAAAGQNAFELQRARPCPAWRSRGAPACEIPTNVTLEARIRPTAAKNSFAVGKNAYGIAVVPKSPGIQFQWVIGVNNVLQYANSQPLPIDRWYTVAATYDGTTMRLFVDGVVAATPARSAARSPRIRRRPSGSGASAASSRTTTTSRG